MDFLQRNQDNFSKRTDFPKEAVFCKDEINYSRFEGLFLLNLLLNPDIISFTFIIA
eukprot:TRINITY_DN15499_c0_g1_i1.p1 TRINITY_DN15499_c0_g1~~TRINITY_DN15499_c0_g1_i1.p1  ORF type:complete len:56 (-),score=14.49 TRINITY_DN15499_c0_g1_i1:16-183(-)